MEFVKYFLLPKPKRPCRLRTEELLSQAFPDNIPYTALHMVRITLLCLHGWGGSNESFRELREALSGSNVEIIAPDLPGFGNEPEPPRPWSTDDYAEWVEEHCAVASPVHLLGHSHGGRVGLSIVLRKRLPVSHLYLCASAGIRHPQRLRKALGVSLAKTGKAVLTLPGLGRLQEPARKVLYKLFRVHDYERASAVMRETLRIVTEEDVRRRLPHIDVPTDIFWGARDRMTPVSDGYLMQREIPQSTLHVFPGIGHRVHRDRASAIADVILRTIG